MAASGVCYSFIKQVQIMALVSSHGAWRARGIGFWFSSGVGRYSIVALAFGLLSTR